MGAVSVVGRQLLTDQGESTVFVLVANFYSLMTKNIPAGSLSLGDWLGHYRVFTGVGIFAYLGLRTLASDDQELLARLQRGSVSFRTFVLGSASVAMEQSLALFAWGKTQKKQLGKLEWFWLKPSFLVLYMLQTEDINSSVGLIWGLQDFKFQILRLYSLIIISFLAFLWGTQFIHLVCRVLNSAVKLLFCHMT